MTLKRNVEEVFVTEGVPQYTFVEPPNFNEILIDIRRPGKPVIIEGQSGTGKTTCVKKVLERIGHESPIQYLTARDATHVAIVQELIATPVGNTYVIDDFHRLGDDIQSQLADLAKMAAESVGPNTLPKLVLIGINQVGSALIQLVPDIAKRTGIHRIHPGTKAEIEKLVASGCEELNIAIQGSQVVFEESRGDYWLTQQLCQTICTINNVVQTVDVPQTIGFDVPALRSRVVDRLKSSYYPAVKEFCRGRRFRPSNDPYYKLLNAISRQESSIVDVNALANSTPDVRGSINNIKDSRLTVLLQSKPICERHFFYNQETRNFAIEDPALFYFLRHLDWEALRVDCGFKQTDRDYEYDFAISFAGENRELARHIADELEVLDANVFFDENFEANFLGKAWSTEFKRIFAKDSRLVVCLLDQHHHDKIWPTFERECFKPRVADGQVIPIYLDDTLFVGIPSDIVGIHFKWDLSDPKWKDKVTDDIVFKLAQRVADS